MAGNFSQLAEIPLSRLGSALNWTAYRMTRSVSHTCNGKLMIECVDENPCLQTLVAHTDMVWDIRLNPFEDILASASSDGSVKLWNVAKAEGNLVGNFVSVSEDEAKDIPTSILWDEVEKKSIYVSYLNGPIKMVDVETNDAVWTFDSGNSPSHSETELMSRILG